MSHVLNVYSLHYILNDSFLLQALLSIYLLSTCQNHILNISQTMLVKY